MSGGYSNVFEQFLQNYPHCSDDNEDSQEDPEGIADLIDSDFTDDEGGGDLSPRETCDKDKHFTSDSAPTLVDDDNEMYPAEKQYFEDDPPILEPVAESTNNSKSPVVRHSSLDPQVPLKSYSQLGMGRSKSSEGKVIKTYSKTDEHFLKNSSKIVKEKGDCLKRPRESGNLFEKFTFTSSNDDVPPPLIPSPEAMRRQSESPERIYHPDIQTNRKHPSCSPDFRAMEADSTSELSRDCVSVHVDKPPVIGDVAVECDSTCMLSCSPAVVSPASESSESEMREQCGSGIDGDAGSPAEQARGANYTGELVRPEPGLLLDPEKSFNGEGSKIKTSEMSQLPMLSLCPGTDATDPSVSLPDLLTSDKTDDKESTEFVQDEPPVLCAIPAAITPQPISKKRHTIDSPYTYCSSDKKSRVYPKVEDEEDLDGLVPPLLPLMSETLADKPVLNNQPKGSRSKSEKLQSTKARKEQHRKERKSRIRHNTFPSVDLVSDVSHLSEDLQHFVQATCQLSALKSSVHSLLQTLFSQTRPELKTMSPESCRFEHVIKDFVETLQQGDNATIEKQPPLTLTIKCDRTAGNGPTVVSQSSQKLRQSSDIPMDSSSRPSALRSDVLYSSYADPATLSSIYPPTSNKRLTRQTTHKEDILATELSKLDLKNSLVKPLKVCVQRTCSNHLNQFCVLCCELLQLLLPELPLSLCSELSDSPADLITFVNNVVASNQKRKH